MMDDVGVLPGVQESADWILVLTELNEFVCLIPSYCRTVQGWVEHSECSSLKIQHTKSIRTYMPVQYYHVMSMELLVYN